MKCPKCNKMIPDDVTVCPHCHKVILLECPICHTVGENAVCEKCGYIIITKCSKCGNIVSTSSEKCKCGFRTATSIAYQECESDEFASLIINFESLNYVRRQLGSQELFSKFYIKLKNLLVAQFKGFEGKIINFDNSFVVNFNKELSFPTSANKAVRLALKIINAFCGLNVKIIDEFNTPLKLNITIIKKDAETLLHQNVFENNVKMLSSKANEAKYLKGMEIIMDQFVWDCISKEYKTDSLYTIEKDGISLMFYELLLESYVIPPSEQTNDAPLEVKPKEIQKPVETKTDDIYGFKVFDINAKCKFVKSNAISLFSQLDNNKLVALRSEKELEINTSKLVQYLEAQNLKVVRVTCTEELNYKPWGVFEQIFKDYYGLSYHRDLIPENIDLKPFQRLLDLICSMPRKASSSEDARFGYMEDFCTFLNSLKNTVIVIEGFEFIDDTTIQTLGLYFDKLKNLKLRFIFITSKENAVHSKFKGFLRTPLYSEYILEKTNIDTILSTLKEDASDLIQSFYFEKIKENYNGSFLYFENAIRYLVEKGVLINFENKLLINSNSSVVLPNTLSGLLKARLKALSKNMEASMILAYSVYLGGRLDFGILLKLGIKDLEKAVSKLIETGFAYVRNNILYINNFNLLKPIIESSFRKNVSDFLSKNILANLGKGLDATTTLLAMGKISMYKEEYLLLWKNSQFSMVVGDYDAYLKNCLGFLSLIEHIENNIPQESLENNKKEVYQNILLSLYSYSPEKILSIEKVLLLDAINKNDEDLIVKLSNLMLQGALISSNYTEALGLLHNIFSNMPNPMLIVDGNINSKFLLLSLVNIEILFNIGDFAQCVEISKDLLSVIRPEVIEKIKPANFSINLFIEHILETFKLAAISKIFLMDDDLDEFFEAVQISFDAELPDKDCLIAIRDFINGKSFSPSGTEDASAFAKVIYLILQEFEKHKDDYKTFAQNIYQAKLLASDIHQTQLELFCDLLIAYSYANIGVNQKAEIIYNDIISKAEKSAIFNIVSLGKYFLAKLKIAQNMQEDALVIINDTLALLQKNNNQSKIIYILFEKLFIETVKSINMSTIDIESEEQKIALLTQGGKLSRLL